MRGLGHIVDDVDARDFDAELLVGISLGNDGADLRSHVKLVRDQGGVGSCVAQSFAAAIEIRSSVLGRNVPQLSPLAIYALARRDEKPLVDDGCKPRDCATGLASFGAVPEERWPYREELANTRIPMDVLQHGADARVSGYYRVGGAGDDRCNTVRAALDKGFPVPMAQVVEQAFMDYSGGILGAFAGHSLGGHMTTIIGYSGDAFLVCNSWGTGWGGSMAGYYWMSSVRLGGPTISDVYVVTLDGDDPRAT